MCTLVSTIADVKSSKVSYGYVEIAEVTWWRFLLTIYDLQEQSVLISPQTQGVRVIVKQDLQRTHETGSIRV